MTFNVRIVRDDGAEFIVDGTTWGVLEAKGFDKPNISVFTEKRAIGDGDIVTGQRVGARDLELKIKTKDSSINEILRRYTTSFFRPANTYDVHIERFGAGRYAPACQVTDVEVPTEKLSKPITVTIGMLCPGGYMIGEEQVDALSSITPRIGYPYISLKDGNFGNTYPVRVYGVRYNATSINVTNDGDVGTYCRISIYATAYATNPTVYVGGNYIRVQTSVNAGDTIIIDPDTLKVTKNGTRIMNSVATGSKLARLILEPGTVVCSYTADTGASNLLVTLYHNNNYMGV